MRPFRILPVAVLLASATAVGAQEIPTAIDAEGVSDISQWAAAIERDKNRFRRIERELPANPRNGTLRLFMQGNQLRKLEATYPAATGRLTRHYYFADDDRLKLVILRESRYENARSERVTARKVEMLWFSADSALYWLAPDGRGIPGAASEAMARAGEVLTDFRSLMAMRAVQQRR